MWHCLGYPVPEVWRDTLKLARRSGLPASLQGMSESLFGIGKHAGSATLNLLCKPHKKTGRYVPLNFRNIVPLAAYNVQDVLIMREAYARTLRFYEHTADDEITPVDLAINDRGYGFDVDTARLLIDIEGDLRKRNGDTLEKLTNGEITRATLRSPQKLKKLFLDRFGLPLENTQKATLLELLDTVEDMPELMQLVIEARIAETGISSAKLIRGLGAARKLPNGRYVIHDMYAIHAADTGRWGGRVIQPQNLPRGVEIENLEDLITLVQEEARAPSMSREELLARIGSFKKPDGTTPTTSGVVGTLTRSCLIPVRKNFLVTADYSSVESRMLLWLASDPEGIDAYRNNLDAYKTMAAYLFQIVYEEVTKKHRKVGKVPVLGCGYGMGGEGLIRFGAAMGIDIEALSGMTGQEIVDAWRDMNWRIAGERTGETYEGHVCRSGGLWKAYHNAAMQAIEGNMNVRAGRCTFGMQGNHLHVVIPSGKILVYRNATIEDVETPWGGMSRTWVYSKSFFKNVLRVAQTKGKITENITQALATGCGGLTGHSLKRLHEEGFMIVGHTHDDVAAEVDSLEEAERFVSVMAETPEWAVGFPQKVVGHIGPYLTKEPLDGWPEITRYYERL